eukprot:1037123-Ditylum_brightwellii.AAC.2
MGASMPPVICGGPTDNALRCCQDLRSYYHMEGAFDLFVVLRGEVRTHLNISRIDGAHFIGTIFVLESERFYVI